MIALHFLLTFFLFANPTIGSIEELKAKEEKRWNQHQNEELNSLMQEKRRLQEEIQFKKEEIQTIRLKIVERVATGHDLFPAQMELQRLLYALQVIEEDIQNVKDRLFRGLYGDILARKYSFEEKIYD
jgi:hypothetical protein